MTTYLDQLLGIGRIYQNGSNQAFASRLAPVSGLKAYVDTTNDLAYLGFSPDFGGALWFASAVSTTTLLPAYSYNSSTGVPVFTGGAPTIDGFNFGTSPGTLLVLSSLFYGLFDTVNVGTEAYAYGGFKRSQYWPYKDPLAPLGSDYWPKGGLIAITEQSSNYYGRGLITSASSSTWLETPFGPSALGSTVPGVPRKQPGQTTNATPASIYTYTVPLGISRVDAVWLGSQTVGGPNSYYKEARFVLKNDGVTTTELGTHQTDSSTSGQVFVSKTDATWSTDYVLSGSSLVLQVTGKAATTINWSVELIFFTSQIP